MGAVVGRSDDLRAIANYLGDACTSASALLIEGEEGIGKTTLWLAALAQAGERGFHTLSARAAKVEADMAYGTVADLFAEVDAEVLTGLPELQRAAVDRVLLRGGSDASSADVHSVAAALLSVVQRLGRRGPVMIGIDDLQWLDERSRAVLAYVARRLRRRTALLLTERPEAGGASAVSWLELESPDGIRRIRVGPIGMAELHELLAVRLGRCFPRPTMRRITEISAGNPFFALELARAIDNGSSGSEAELPRTLADLVRIRVEDLSDDTWRVLLAAACVADPTVEALARATGTSVRRTLELLDDAERQGVIVVHGNRVHYRHPLLAKGVYSTTAPALRREMHGRLADVVTQPELKARHMALAASTADPELLRALDKAACSARAKGSPAAAAELLDLAIKLGGDTPSRRIHAAENHLRAGDAARAGDLVAPVIDQLPPGPQRAFALNLLAGTTAFSSSVDKAAALLQRAVGEAEDSPQMLLPTLLALSFAQSLAGCYDEALQIAKRAVGKAEKLGVPALVSKALANYVTINALDGNGIDEVALDRALELDDLGQDVSAPFMASAAKAQLLAWTGRLDEARVEWERVRRRCIDHGADSDLIFVAVHTALVEIWRGRFTDAGQAATEAVRLAEELGGDQMVSVAKTMRAAAAAYAGRESDARADIEGAMAAVERCGTTGLAYWPMSVLGFLEVSLGNHAEAAAALSQCCDDFPEMPGTEIVTASFIPDAVEALIALGRQADAEPMIKALEHNGALFDRPWMLAVGGRCRAMMLAAQGEVEAAEQAARQALTEFGRLPMPFERARTQLLLGQLQRRRRQKMATEATLGEALRTFEQMGSALWVQRAHAELERANVGPTRGADLTPSERRVAELAGAGMTTADVAARLCVSPKTVEANLTRIYRKFDIHTRAELGRIMGTSGQ
ncbi:AAA family ATPase [Mycobacterium sp. 3519A]|uniref:helix-turn-helix transcriptional regulator n=1 Tax=Mycobacterium sp. 3519A TaxID=2057184 RepID=UPI000C7CC9FF|nr:AAA family ATPase [Mycobacterium sp. 3519A]